MFMKILCTSIVCLLFNTMVFGQHLPKAPIQGGLKSHDHGMMYEIEALHHQEQHDPSYRPIPKCTVKRTSEQSLQAMDMPDTSCRNTIPVVFHVFHPKGAEGVPLSQLEFAIDDLNRTFAGTDADFGTVNPLFANAKSYSTIRFALAKLDPFGRSTNGVVYYTDRQGGFGNIGPQWENQIRTYAWDNYKYLNVYVQLDLYANNTFNNSGVCWYPSTFMSDNGIARMVYNYVYLGKGGSSYNYLEFNQTFTHEAGHYLDLRHTFDGNSCTGQGDLCDDTPPTDVAAGGCEGNRCNGIINGENYMDYNTTCYKNFTIDQVARMDAAMKHPARSTLWTPYNLVATGLLSPTSTDTCYKSPYVSYTTEHVQESLLNDGSLANGTIIIHACNGARFAMQGKTLVAGEHYSPIELPEGLKEQISVNEDGTIATLNFTGKALRHSSNDTKASVTFTMFDEAFSSGTEKAILNISKQLRFEFRDPWKKTCVDTYVRASADTIWNVFELQGPYPRFFGMWKNGDVYAIENYGRGFITESANSSKAVFLEPGTVIGPGSTWNQGGAPIVLHAPDHVALDGKTGYVGFRIQVRDAFHYGWMRIAVSGKDGCTLLEYQYNEKPNEGIVAGADCSVALSTKEDFVEEVFSISPNPAHDNVIIQFGSNIPRKGKLVLSMLNGVQVQELNIVQSSQEFSLKDLAAGVYIMSLHDESGILIHSQAIIKQ